jgi:hypothetical protein
MDQVKDILKKAIQYRFWIAVGIAALMPMIAYFAAAGSLQEEATKKEAEIKSASTDVKQYESGVLPNGDYKTLVEARTEVLNKEVNSAWKKLYSRQEYLLDWPDEVEEYYRAWGNKWPEAVDPSFVAQTALTYAQVYPQEVEKVYKLFRPFDYEEGTGVVAAPPRDDLLRPADFDLAKFDINNPPNYGKVWAAQQKLWIQGVVLDVVDKVNTGAEDWDAAPIKEIVALQVANPLAQDQRSIAKGETLELAPEIVKPGSESAADTAAPASTDSAGMEGGMASMGSQMMMMMGRMGGGMSGGMGGGAQTAPDEVYFLKTENASPAFQTAPVYLAVLIDQSRMLELFDAFSKSPMAIQVVDFEMKRPASPVKKPEKGKNTLFNMGGGSGEYFLGGGMMMGAQMGMEAGMMANYASGMRAGMMGGGGYPGMGMMDQRSMYAGMMGGAAATPKKTGTSIKAEQIKKDEERKKAAEEAEKQADEEKAAADSYFYIVEVHIYGQARFYNPPPADEPAAEAPESAGNTPGAAEPAQAGDEADSGEPAKTGDEAPAPEAEPTAPAAEDAPTPGAEPAKPEDEAPQAEPEKIEDPADEPKAEPTPADAPK